MKLTKKFLVLLLLALAINGMVFINPRSASAAKKVSLNTKKLTVMVGQSKRLKLKNNKKKVKWKVVSGKKNISLRKKKKTGLTIVGRKKGTAKVQAVIGKKKLACKITVKKNNKASMNFSSEAFVKVGDTLTLKLHGNTESVTWKVDGPKQLRTKEKSKNKIVLEGLNSGTAKVSAKIGGQTKTCKVTIEEKYSYELTPLLAPFNSYYYLKTDDPNPFDLSFVDESSVYYTSDIEQAELYDKISPCNSMFCDVKYVDEKYYRVNGGYICSSNSSLCDGGKLKMKRKLLHNRNGYQAYNVIGGPGQYWEGEVYVDTVVTVDCPVVKTSFQYLIDVSGGAEKSFFEKLDNIQGTLDEWSAYPRSILDTSKPNKGIPYPFLASSPYEELHLNSHIQMYEYMEDGWLAQSLYPFVVDSVGFPRTMAYVARCIDPTCTVESGPTHSDVVITKNGESHTYGGMGRGGTGTLLNDRVEKIFLFDGSEVDYGTNATLKGLLDKLLKYAEMAYEDAAQYEDLLTGDTFRKTIGIGNWLRIGMEPYWTDRTPDLAYAYVTQLCSGGMTYICSDAWVDGRYINTYETYQSGARFEDHSTANIVLRNQTYTTKEGDVKTADVIYTYNYASNDWRAYHAYSDSNGYYVDEELPDQFILTPEDVAEMDIDRNTDIPPEHGLIYDSTQYPGTPF